MKIVIQKDANGDNRKGVLKNCNHCNQEFFTRLDQNKKYCSKHCSSLHRVKLITLTCDRCGLHFDRNPSKCSRSKSGKNFCSIECSGKERRIIEGEIQPKGSGGNRQYRSLFKEENLYCERCNYTEFPKCVEIHHIDQDRSNNKISNLMMLCPNCHRSLHGGYWKIGETSRLATAPAWKADECNSLGDSTSPLSAGGLYEGAVVIQEVRLGR